ncbi:helix-turn-helix domain-containing protein [Bacillus sp. FJAT-22090]|uniref:helix-turn-helix domain-containing protein n=1 Tax=Bacillus sp. FJAT-22090 TaxID=1581038 RepID=UPI0011A0DCCF|nr:helix-turn-helix transcriptional regulator [Bacillus sp. FJAT-22090]
MTFYKRIREYREQLEITQIEASRRLGIDHSVLSKYERGDLSIPIELLNKFIAVYNIPQEKFFEMLTDKKHKSDNPGLEARESRARYLETFQEEIVAEITPLKEFRDLVMDIVSISSNDNERRRFIAKLRNKT